MKTFSALLIPCSMLLLLACQKQEAPLTDEQKNQIADSARQVVQKVLDFSNNLDFNSALQAYSSDPDARYVENGTVFASLDAMRTAYEQMAPTLEVIENKVDSWDMIVLSKEAVLMTVPIHFKIKAKGLAEYNGQYVWSGVVQKRNGKWTIIQTHESWLNFAEAMSALTPPK